MQGQAAVKDELLIPTPLSESSHRITIRRCVVKRRRLVPQGEAETLNLDEAAKRLAPSRSHKARANVLKLRPGQFIGVTPKTGTNFVIVNPTTDGDIRWLFERVGGLEAKLQEVYLVEDVVIENNTVDLSVGPRELSNTPYDKVSK